MNYTKSFVILFLNALIMYSLLELSTNISLSVSSNNMTLNAKPIYHGEGKIIGKRILEKGPEGWKQEVTYQGTGNFSSGINIVSEYWTFVNTHRPDGVIQGEGNGVLSVLDKSGTNTIDTITIKGHGRGFLDLHGQTVFYPTAQLYDTPLNYNGSLSFLNKVVGIAFWNVDPNLGTYVYNLYILEQ